MCKQAETDALLDEATRLAGAGNLKGSCLTMIAAIRLLAERRSRCRCTSDRAEDTVAEPAVPNAETRAAIEEATEMLAARAARFTTAEEGRVSVEEPVVPEPTLTVRIDPPTVEAAALGIDAVAEIETGARQALAEEGPVSVEVEVVAQPEPVAEPTVILPLAASRVEPDAPTSDMAAFDAAKRGRGRPPKLKG